MAGFYPIYATAQSTFEVNWLLLASIHRQKSAFSTAAGAHRMVPARLLHQPRA
jgi:hypothetical protein